MKLREIFIISIISIISAATIQATPKSTNPILDNFSKILKNEGLPIEKLNAKNVEGIVTSWKENDHIALITLQIENGKFYLLGLVSLNSKQYPSKTEIDKMIKSLSDDTTRIMYVKDFNALSLAITNDEKSVTEKKLQDIYSSTKKKLNSLLKFAHLVFGHNMDIEKAANIIDEKNYKDLPMRFCGVTVYNDKAMGYSIKYQHSQGRDYVLIDEYHYDNKMPWKDGVNTPEINTHFDSLSEAFAYIKSYSDIKRITQKEIVKIRGIDFLKETFSMKKSGVVVETTNYLTAKNGKLIKFRVTTTTPTARHNNALKDATISDRVYAELKASNGE